MAVELKVPEAGESVTEVEIGEWLKSEGDAVEQDETVVVLETDKASMELPAPATGRLASITVQEGEKVSIGDVIGTIEEGESGGEDSGEEKAADAEDAEDGKDDASQQEAADKGQSADTKEADKADAEDTEKKSAEEEPKRPKKKGKRGKEEERKEKAEPPRKDEREEADADEGGEPEDERERADKAAGPAARRAMYEHGVQAAEVRGSGEGGRILKEDVLRHAKGEKKEQPAESREREEPVEAEPAPVSRESRGEEIVPMSLLRRRVAERLVQAQQTAAQLTTFNEADMSAVMQLRRAYQDDFTGKYGIKLGFMSFFVKASIEALKLIPEVNAEICESQIVYRNYCDVGVAISGKRGLVVPVLRNAERLSFAETEKAIADFAARAGENRLKPEELSGGTFTISNGGVFGSMLSTPILNPPQSGILGMHSIQERPVARNGEVVIKPMMYLALTYDHRIVDGREAVTFLKRIKDCIEDPTRILIEA